MVNLQNLAKQFEKRTWSDLPEAERMLGYPLTRFRQMIGEYGAVEATKRVIAIPGTPSDFADLWEKQRLDLTAEAIVLLPEFRPLLIFDTLNRACRRLKDVKYTPPWAHDICGGAALPSGNRGA